MTRLFGQKSFSEFEYDLMQMLTKTLKGISDATLVANKDSIEELAKKICNPYYMNCDVKFNFNVKKASVETKPMAGSPGREKRLVVYSIPVTGNTDYLGINPFKSNDSGQIVVDFSIKNGHFTFAIDTHYYGDLEDKHVAMAKASCLALEDHVNIGLDYMNQLCAGFNEKIDKEVTEVLKGMLPAAIKRQSAIEKLNS